MYTIFLTLLVQDLARAQAFYEGLGFRVDQHSSDDRVVTVIVDDRIVISLTTSEAFAELVSGEVGDPAAGATSVNCLSVGARDAVDDLLARAEASGGATWWPDRQEPATYTGSFADPDGHSWRITYLEPMHVID